MKHCFSLLINFHNQNVPCAYSREYLFVPKIKLDKIKYNNCATNVGFFLLTFKKENILTTAAKLALLKISSTYKRNYPYRLSTRTYTIQSFLHRINIPLMLSVVGLGKGDKKLYPIVRRQNVKRDSTISLCGNVDEDTALL